MPIKRRDVLILVSVWLLGCLIVLVLLGLFYASNSAPAPDQPKPIATFVIPTSGDTAKTAYRLALKPAQKWQQDVSMVAISTYWPAAAIDNLGQAQGWDLRFYSPGRQRLYFTIVTTGQQVLGRAHLGKLRYPPPLIDPAQWLIDSDEAIRTWANKGGGVFIKNFPGSRVEAILRQDPGRARPVWDMLGISADQSQVFYLAIDATNGEVLNQ